jgi:hypothetical protein
MISFESQEEKDAYREQEMGCCLHPNGGKNKCLYCQRKPQNCEFSGVFYQ